MQQEIKGLALVLFFGFLEMEWKVHRHRHCRALALVLAGRRPVPVAVTVAVLHVDLPFVLRRSTPSPTTGLRNMKPSMRIAFTRLAGWGRSGTPRGWPRWGSIGGEKTVRFMPTPG